MLNLFKLKKNTKLINPNKRQTNLTLKHFPSPTREWYNSIYVYNTYNINLIPSTTTFVTNMVKFYFNLYNKHLESKMRTKKLLLRFRKLSSNRYYVSKGVYKHTNNKVCVNLYVFNRQKDNNLLRLRKWYLKTFLKKSLDKNININLSNRLKIINNKGLEAVKLVNKDKYLVIKAINNINNSKYNINTINSLRKYTESFYKILISKSLKKIRMYFYYRQLLQVNKSKLNYSYLQYLKKYIEKVYNKNVEFNIINLKRFYLNSDILSESMSNKLIKSRRSMIKYLNNVKNKVILRKKKIFLGFLPTLNPKLENLTPNKTSLQTNVISNLKYRHVTGFRLEAKGRLSKRFSASRSIYKNRYNGGIYNIDSSDRGLSSVVLKGNLKVNSQYTILNSKSRIGSFGIKGWVSGN